LDSRHRPLVLENAAWTKRKKVSSSDPCGRKDRNFQAINRLSNSIAYWWKSRPEPGSNVNGSCLIIGQREPTALLLGSGRGSKIDGCVRHSNPEGWPFVSGERFSCALTIVISRLHDCVLGDHILGAAFPALVPFRAIDVVSGRFVGGQLPAMRAGWLQCHHGKTGSRRPQIAQRRRDSLGGRIIGLRRTKCLKFTLFYVA